MDKPVFLKVIFLRFTYIPVVTSPFLLSGDWSGECCTQLKESHVL